MRNRLVTSLTAIALAAAALVFGHASPASACSCSGGTDEEMFTTADVVFTGRLVDRNDPGMSAGRSSAAFSTLRFDVDAVYKGEAAVDQVVVTEQSGASCGLEITGSGPFVVFGSRSHWDDQVPEGMVYAGLCNGTRSLASQPVPTSFGTARSPTAPPAGDRPSTTAPSLDDGGSAGLLLIAGIVATIAATALVVITRRRGSTSSPA